MKSKQASYRVPLWVEKSTGCSFLLAGAMLLSPLAAVCASTSAHPGFAGVYISRGGKKDPSLNVSLGPDGTATVTEDPGAGAMTLFGHWVDEGNQLKVIFDADEGAPRETSMVFEANHDGLQPVSWDHAAWGKVAPPVLKKGFKVKEAYWFDTVR